MQGYKLLLVLWLVFALGQMCFSALTETKIKTNYGGGDCVDPEDCNNNGICKPDSAGKGKCCCAIGFAGEACDAKDTDPVGKAVPADKGKTSKGKTRTKIVKTSTGEARSLEYDQNSDVLALTPDSLADAKQPFLIYNPDKKTYLFVSKDIKATGKKNPYVEARNDRLGRRNMFTFEEVKDQKDKYFIFNVELKAYLYVSNSKSGVVRYWNNNVLASTEKPTEADQLKKYIFEFEDDDGDGFYKIKNQEKYLYVSAHYFGVPANALVKATNQKELDRWDSKFFQFALKDKAKVIKLSVDTNEESLDSKTYTDNEQSARICNDAGDDDADKDAMIKYKDSSKETRTYSRTQGFSVGAQLGSIKSTMGQLTFTYKNDQTNTEALESIKEVEKSITVRVKPKKCACIRVSFSDIHYQRKYVLEAETKDSKKVKATGVIDGSRLSNFEALTTIIDYKKDGKCPHQVN